MKTTEFGGKSGKLWLALVCGMGCSSVLMLTGHSHAAAIRPAVQNAIALPAVVITGKRLTAEEKAQVRAELAQQEGQAPHA